MRHGVPPRNTTRPGQLEGLSRRRIASRAATACYAFRVKIVSQRELRKDNAVIIRGVEAGEEYVVTRRGVPVARLVPIGRAADLRCDQPAKQRPTYTGQRRARAPSRPRRSSVTCAVIGDPLVSGHVRDAETGARGAGIGGVGPGHRRRAAGSGGRLAAGDGDAAGGTARHICWRWMRCPTSWQASACTRCRARCSVKRVSSRARPSAAWMHSTWPPPSGSGGRTGHL